MRSYTDLEALTRALTGSGASKTYRPGSFFISQYPASIKPSIISLDALDLGKAYESMQGNIERTAFQNSPRTFTERLEPVKVARYILPVED